MVKMNKLSEEKIEVVSKEENITFEQVGKFFLETKNGELFINHKGLMFFLNKKYEHYSLETELIDNKLQGIVAKCIVTLYKEKGKEEIFTGIGSATKDNTGEYTNIYLVEMAETRAINRAVKRATKTNYVSQDEIQNMILCDRKEVWNEINKELKKRKLNELLTKELLSNVFGIERAGMLSINEMESLPRLLELHKLIKQSKNDKWKEKFKNWNKLNLRKLEESFKEL